MRFVVRQSVDMTPKQLAILLEEDKRQLGNRLFHHSPNIFGQFFNGSSIFKRQRRNAVYKTTFTEESL